MEDAIPPPAQGRWFPCVKIMKTAKEIVARFLSGSEPIEDNQYKPDFFSETWYRDPTDEQLKDINTYNFPAEKIINGFSYSLVGRGMMHSNIKDQIVKGITRLCNMYPKNNEYKKALKDAQGLKLFNPSITAVDPEGDVVKKYFPAPEQKPPRRRPGIKNKSNRSDYMRQYMTDYRKEQGKDFQKAPDSVKKFRAEQRKRLKEKFNLKKSTY